MTFLFCLSLKIILLYTAWELQAKNLSVQKLLNGYRAFGPENFVGKETLG